MRDHAAFTFTAKILRKQDDLPRYVVVKPEHVTGFSTSFAAQVTLNDCTPPFARTIHPPWGARDHTPGSST